jgi:hypothetical protein
LLAIDIITEPVREFDATLDDAGALQQLASTCQRRTSLKACKPTPEYEDMFGRLTYDRQAALIARFADLNAALQFAKKEPETRLACERLASVLGEDFPVPDEDDEGEKTKGPAIVTSSSSA